MGDVLLIAVFLASFALVIGLIQVISRMLERDTGRGELADEPPDSGTPDCDSPGNALFVCLAPPTSAAWASHADPGPVGERIVG
jgi:hypothetical protein